MTMLRTIDEIEGLRGKRVLVRVDLNVPTKKGKTLEDGEWRLRQALPVIEDLTARGARVVLASHRGRPGGKKTASLSMKPVAARLSELLGREVAFAPDCIGKKAEAAVEDLKDGGVVLLENVRFKKGEQENDPRFAKKFAALADIYVNDAFATAHREAASLVAVTEELPSYAGPLMIKEIGALESVMRDPEKPLVTVMGGAKISSKIGAIEKMLEISDRVLLGGALIVPFFKARGYGIGAYACEEGDVEAARALADSERAARLILPHDVITGHPKNPKERVDVVEMRDEPFEICESPRAVVDIGPKTVSAYASYLRSARTIVWNGPLGLFEEPRYSHGTLSVGRLIAARSKKQAYGLVGGGETVMALEMTGLADCVDHVSTGGGAMLAFIEGARLPAIEALKKR